MPRSHPCRKISQCSDEQLQRGQTLLPVDHFRSRNTSADDTGYVQYDRAEKMRPPKRLPLSVQTGFRLPLDVFPKRLPLPLLSPNISSLIERYDISALALKQLVDGQLVWFHNAPPALSFHAEGMCAVLQP
ncbi:hypothetical protein D3C87_1426170 [compost metagenome]